MTCLANDFEPSILAAAAAGPKQAIPAARSASAAPATSGASGPTTTRSGLSLRASARICSGAAVTSGYVWASCAMPGLPGAAWTSSVLRARTRACSRPPDPMTSMRTPGAYRRPLTAAREPLVGQHREVQLVAPPALEELVVDQAGLLPHAEPPGQPRRRLVVLVDPRDDAMQAELLEAEPQHAVRRLGGIAMPAQGRVDRKS